MGFAKKQSAGIWATLITLIFALVSFIIYNINLRSEGYFKNAAVPSAVKYTVIGMCLLFAVLVLAQINVKGAIGQLLLLVIDAMRIGVPALFLAASITLVSARIQGFAFIYFSNPEVLQEVQTKANLSSSHGAIATIAGLVITSVIGIIAAFFSVKKKVA